MNDLKKPASYDFCRDLVKFSISIDGRLAEFGVPGEKLEDDFYGPAKHDAADRLGTFEANRAAIEKLAESQYRSRRDQGIIFIGFGDDQ